MFVPTFPEVFDSSMVASFKSCPQLFYKIYIQQWKSKERSVHLHAGGAYAHGVERARRAFFEEGASSEDAVADGVAALLQFYGDFECPPDSAKSAQRTAGALEYYFTQYPLEHGKDEPIIMPGGKRGIEFSFVHPLAVNHPDNSNPILFSGRMDAIIDYAGGVFICDEKTTTALGASWSKQWDLRAQFTGYAWGCREAGIKVDGVVVRGVSILKTKYDTQAPISYRPEWQLDRWHKELLEWIEDIKICWATGRWKYNLDHACADYGGCGFRSACMSQDEQPWLETYFERRRWDPITRKEEPV